MQALVIDRKEQRLKLQQRPIPTCGDDEVLVKMIASGVCGTDISVIKGKIGGTDGAINGHEGLGEVHEIGKDVRGELKVGTRVVIQPNLSCKTCADCVKYKGINSNFCQNHTTYGIHHDGTMSEFAVFQSEYVKPVPAEFKSLNAVLVEPLSTVLHGYWRIQPPIRREINPKVLILGCGMIGLLWLRVLQSENFIHISCTDKSMDRMTVAQKIGATPISITELFESQETFDLVIDCTGHAPCLSETVRRTATGGTAVLFGCCPENVETSVIPYNMWKKEMRLITSYICDKGDEFNRAIEHAWHMEQKGLLELKDFQVQLCTFQDIDPNWQKLEEKTILKLIIVSPNFRVAFNGDN